MNDDAAATTTNVFNEGEDQEETVKEELNKRNRYSFDLYLTAFKVISVLTPIIFIALIPTVPFLLYFITMGVFSFMYEKNNPPHSRLRFFVNILKGPWFLAQYVRETRAIK